ncbi:RNA polymerase II mediator complex component SRB4 [Ophiocordyceps camponoti-floridani]|uniref:Mediator of RNA polymerase II transcription subunit 17 n=1 Tax=Ophiocordyceps camponoti-floridani TaxID=2030778 RepID=A0A8H4QCS8_9HYPO|nr:RNA polymerase II mediator complex component SRB4 [Ophiocordyceps camponoti-floridani]
MWDQFTNYSCLPDANAPCTARGYPPYVINASTAGHVKTGIDFARNHNIRLVVKNSGHDFIGRSVAPGALSIWAHNLNSIKFKPDELQLDGSNRIIKTNSLTVGGGVQMFDAYKAADQHGQTITGGGGKSVSFGGYVSGGGHSFVAPYLGLAADNILQMEVVTPAGDIIAVNEDRYPDLFWALRGGGGSTFGVITSLTIKTYPKVEVSYTSFKIVADPEAPFLWDMITFVISQLPYLMDSGLPSRVAGVSGQNLILNASEPNMAEKIFKPINDTLHSRWPGKVLLHLETQHYPTFLAWFEKNYDASSGGYSRYLVSRLLDKQSLTGNETALQDALRAANEPNGLLAFFTVAGKGVQDAKPRGGDAVHPAWRQAYVHSVATAEFPPFNKTAERQAIAILDRSFQPLRDLTPRSGAYMNEALPFERDWQHTFWGSNYERLLAIKKRVDPDDVLCRVGSLFPALRHISHITQPHSLTPISDSIPSTHHQFTTKHQHTIFPVQQPAHEALHCQAPATATMSAAEATFLSLRPVPIDDKEPKNLAEFISRVNAQPGGFRHVTESALREAMETNGDVSVEDVVMVDAVEEEDAAVPSKDAASARLEVLKGVDIAGNTAMLILDSLSLLLSKQSPTSASVTLSQQLRDMVGIGTLSVDRLDEPTAREERVKEGEQVATGWTLMEINKTRDAAVSAAALLDKEVAIESRYWDDVMAVKKAGWSMCRVPNERHTLGVRFGFSETSAEFKNNGLAPMRRGEDGSVELDVGRLGGVSECLVVSYVRNDRVVGRSRPHRRQRNANSLESRVLEARNTIFSQELWHELIKEARTLAAYDVRLQGSKLRCRVDDETALIMELLELGSCPAPDDSLPHNGMAEAVSLGLHMLLSYAHRHNELMRTRPMPPHMSRSRPTNQTYALLRPVIARLASDASIEACTRLVGSLSRSLTKAGLSSSFTLRPSSSPTTDTCSSTSNHASPSQTLIRNMLQPRDLAIDFTILPDTSLSIRLRTFLFPVTSSHFNVSLPPDSPSAPRAPPYQDGYPDVRALADYLDTAVSRCLTRHFLSRLLTSDADGTGRRWTESIVGTSIRDPDSDRWTLRFSTVRNDADPIAVAALVLVSSVVGPDGDPPRRSTWKWSSGENPDDESRPMADVVAEVARMSPS